MMGSPIKLFLFAILLVVSGLYQLIWPNKVQQQQLKMHQCLPWFSLGYELIDERKRVLFYRISGVVVLTLGVLLLCLGFKGLGWL